MCSYTWFMISLRLPLPTFLACQAVRVCWKACLQAITTTAGSAELLCQSLTAATVELDSALLSWKLMLDNCSLPWHKIWLLPHTGLFIGHKPYFNFKFPWIYFVWSHYLASGNMGTPWRVVHILWHKIFIFYLKWLKWRKIIFFTIRLKTIP